jgi:hypothetical protein
MTFDYGSEGHPVIEPLRVVKATPERAFAELAYKEKLEDYETKQDQLPLPLCSFVRTDLTPDKSRFRVSKFHASYTNPPNMLYPRASTKDEIYRGCYPQPYNLTYQLDFWARYEATIDQIRVWLALAVRYLTYFYLPVNFSSLPGFGRFFQNQNVYVTFSGLQDASDLEPGAEQRIERVTSTLDVQGWFFFPEETQKTVLDGIVDVSITTEVGVDLDTVDPATLITERVEVKADVAEGK